MVRVGACEPLNVLPRRDSWRHSPLLSRLEASRKAGFGGDLLQLIIGQQQFRYGSTALGLPRILELNHGLGVTPLIGVGACRLHVDLPLHRWLRRRHDLGGRSEAAHHREDVLRNLVAA